jgi:NADH dehydrogenase [ubiquinone] 1 alpha subcomplex assembly factor 7
LGAPGAASSGGAVSALAATIARRIRAEGPLPVAAYMAMALHDPLLGYYATRDPFGPRGDYVTAPELSQVFGELIGLWCADLWQRSGAPTPLILAELGPGRGLLACDLLRAAASVPEFRRAIRLHLVESSPRLRAEQKARLDFADAVWMERTDALPSGPMLLVANEFLDALPIRQFVRGKRLWSERLVALDNEDRLVFVDGPQSLAASLLVPEARRESAGENAVVEICPAALALASSLGARFKEAVGAALFIDYGSVSGPGRATLRAYRGHRQVPPLAQPGAADLTADVDFGAFLEAARQEGARCYGPVTQGRFLAALGIAERLAVLCRGAGAAARERLEKAVESLVDPQEMGRAFKVAAIASPGLPAPEGFFDRGAEP